MLGIVSSQVQKVQVDFYSNLYKAEDKREVRYDIFLNTTYHRRVNKVWIKILQLWN